MAPQVLGVCEDDDVLRSALKRGLEGEGFRVVAVASGRAAIERFLEVRPAAIVLDIGLPDADGRDVCQALRAGGVVAPVLFLTARDAVTDRISGFNVGGDDYLTKPFSLGELYVRVRALLRRSAARPPAVPETGLRLDPAALRLHVGERSAELTPTEFRLLAALVAGSGSVLRRNELTSTAWPEGAIVHDNTLDTYVTRLRRHLRAVDAPVEIRTARGVGYELR
ncbi:MAG: response regulator transcription factor [Rubrobacter sp.]|nr:response regulator transcription factor [Rubrobacter sp.]